VSKYINFIFKLLSVLHLNGRPTFYKFNCVLLRFVMHVLTNSIVDAVGLKSTAVE